MSNYNLSEAAAEILTQSVKSAGKENFGAGKKLTPTPGQKEVDLGTAGHKTTDANYDAAKEISQATLPTGKGVASEPMKKLSGQPAQSGSVNQPEGEETSEEGKVNRKKGPVAKATSPVNSGAKAPYVPEDEAEEEWEPEEEDQEWEDEELEEATMEEVMKDLESMDEEAFEEKYGCDKGSAKDQMEKISKKEAKKAEMDKTMKEDIEAMLSGENLSEEFKGKASMIFEAAVNSRVEMIAEELEEKFTEQFEETVELVKEDFAEKLDSYLDYVVENWMEENTLAVEKGLRSEIVEDFIGALKNVFVEHYIDIPEDRVDVVEELVSKVEELEDTVNEHIEKNIELKKKLYEHEKQEAIHAVCEGLTLSQAEKIKSLAKSVEFVSEEDFSDKLETIKESYFPTTIKSASPDALNETVEFDEDATTKVVDPVIEAYVNKIGKLYKF
jgi:hypothetical protein